MKKTVVIPAAGLGSRLGEFTKNYSKAMCTLGKKPIISYIIEKFDDMDEIIVLLGYKGDYLRQVITACHPNKNITFVNVDKFEGPGSGLGYSLYCAKDFLQKPFIFWSCDTIIESLDLSTLDYSTNWMIGGNADNAFYDNYRHIMASSIDGKVISILPKLCQKDKEISCYTGVSYIKDYEEFWSSYSDAFIENGESYGLNSILAAYKQIRCYNVSDWIDVGNLTIFEEVKKQYASKMEETILEKPDEAIWFIDDKVVKFHISTKFISDRVKRFKTMLNEFQIEARIKLPELLTYSSNTYTYKRAPGIIASKVVTNDMLHDILSRYLDSIQCVDISFEEQLTIYNDFYKDKTLSRINKYCNDFSDIDNDCVIINGLTCESATKLIETLNWVNLASKGVFTNNYHGDFHLENILVNNGEYIMLDWRQNFGNSMVGDAYYDIAKMWHSLIVNHDMVKRELFTVDTVAQNEVKIDIHRTWIDTECEKELERYIKQSAYDINMAKLMTAVIFLNIAACHVYPYSKFLFYLGKYMINVFYNEHPEFWDSNLKN